MAHGIYRRGKRKDAWTIMIDLPPEEQGKRNQRSFTFHGTYKEAQLERARLKLEADKGLLGKAGKITVAEFMEKWLEHIEQTRAPRTVLMYVGASRNRIVPMLGHIQLDRLKPTDIVAWQAKLRDAGRVDKKPGTLLPTSLRIIYMTLHIALETAVKWRLISSNPCTGVDPPKGKPKNMQALSPDQARALLESSAQAGTLWNTFFTLAVTTGLRLGELRALHWKDIDLAKKSLTVRQTAQYLPGKRIHVREPKTAGSRRQVLLGDDVVAILRKHRREQNEQRLARGADWQDLDLVFAKEDGYYVGEERIRVAFRRILAAAGLPNIRIHDLRHTAATLLMVAGVPTKVIQERLGHANVNITLQLYSHVSETLQEQAASKMDAMLKKSENQ